VGSIPKQAKILVVGAGKLPEIRASGLAKKRFDKIKEPVHN
jgi:hypothetical protein